ncbi:hypothetical protein AURDEDRAFT_161015 [Auricularia subglabra TFB-10046 SS5]|nr:hypothetical protein AURDEDRAFT_161015 [Auricularia subglabra TFB-10046 SS5]
MPITSLPDDVLKTVFDVLDVHSFHECSHVSQLWRAIARHHPRFWRTLSIRDKGLTLGAAELFLDRLNSKTGDEKTISLTLTVMDADCSIMRDLALPAISRHIERCEKLLISVSATATAFVWPLFSIAAPRLRVLHVRLCHATDPLLHVVPALMFDVAAYSSLEYVVLENVPLPHGLQPVAHTIKSYVVKYSYPTACIREALAWIPRTRSFGVHIDPSDSGLPTTSIGHLVDNHPFLTHLERLVIHDNRLLHLPICSSVPVLGIHMSAPDSSAVLGVLPPRSLLCMSIRTIIYHGTRRGSPTQHQIGDLTATDVDRTVIRCCHGLSVAHMTSRTFLGRLVATERLVLLDVELRAGFLQMCQSCDVLPQLRVLCVIIDRLPGMGEMDDGELGCPALRTLAFERAHTLGSVDITRAAVESFIASVLNTVDETSLDIILRDVRMSGHDGAGGRISRVRHQMVAVERSQPGELREQREITRLTWMFAE